MIKLQETFTLPDGVELVKPEAESGVVSYDRKRDIATIEVLFYITSTENQIFTYSRSYEMECKTSWDKSDAVNAFLKIFEGYEYSLIEE